MLVGRGGTWKGCVIAILMIPGKLPMFDLEVLDIADGCVHGGDEQVHTHNHCQGIQYSWWPTSWFTRKSNQEKMVILVFNIGRVQKC